MTSNRIQIAADSVCDLPEEIVSALGIRIIPTYVNTGGESIADDGHSLSRARFYRDLPKMQPYPTTAAPSPGDAEAFYRSMLEDGAEHVVSVHVPAQLSGTINAMRLGAKAAGADRVTVVDSLQLTFGIGLQVWAAAELANSEEADVPSILDAIERVRRNSQVYAIIRTMEYLRRGGRVNAMVAGLGGLIKISPVITVDDGAVTSIGRVRTWSRAVARLRELTLAQAPFHRLAILHVANRRGAEQFLDSIQDVAPSDTLVIETTPTVGTHIGPGAIGVATLSNDWRR